jgi:hypothetical protein
MIRECLYCRQRFTPSDLAKRVSRKIEAERKSSGLRGFLFRCYVCSRCGQENLFVEFHPLQGETTYDLNRRRDDLEATIKQSRQGGVLVTLVERRPEVVPSVIAF